MRPEPVWMTVALAGCLLGCARGDVSHLLESGLCNDQAKCADGYVCDTSNWQCVKLGTPIDAQPPLTDVASPPDDSQPDVATPLDGSQPDVATPPPTDAVDSSADPVRCDNGLTRCGSSCVDTRSDPAHCGTCASTCVAGGVVLACGTYVPGTCDCAGDNSRCGATGSNALCDATGRCSCDGQACVPGEICGATPTGATTCVCDGRETCGAGTTCCLGYGCVDLMQQVEHCGACGNACPAIHACQGGVCHCRNDRACQAGAAGTCNALGRCVCGGTECGPGQRCLADGSCG